MGRVQLKETNNVNRTDSGSVIATRGLRFQVAYLSIKSSLGQPVLPPPPSSP